MTAIEGLVGLRPHVDCVETVSAPPYDVIKPGTELETLLRSREESLFHVTLGDTPVESLQELIKNERLVTDDEPAYYVYEQCYGTDGSQRRLGVFAATAVTDYAEQQVIRHEKTFDDKVQGRIKLTRDTGYTFGPVFLLTRASISSVLEEVLATTEPLYAFTTDLNGMTDLHGIANRIVRVPQDSESGKKLQELVGTEPLYIADGHHRYHAALKNGQTHVLSYIVEDAHIQAYNRVITGEREFAAIKDQLPLEPCDNFVTPEKHSFCVYTAEGSYMLKAQEVPSDVVGRLDCSILERELYPSLGLNHSHIVNPAHFDYYAESELDTMKACVDSGTYNIAVALHPVSIDELMSVADAGLNNSDIVMPEKSTFFAPKILSGLFVYKHRMK